MRLYIAGPMTGLPNFNYPAFFQAEEELKKIGHTPLNPARNDGDTAELAIAHAGTPEQPAHAWEYYLRRDIPKVVSADGLVLLPGWQSSAGAALETHIATTLSMPMYILRDGKLLPRVQIIGLSGYGQSGKDTIGTALAEHGYRRVSLADYIREALGALDPIIEPGVRVSDLVREHGWEASKNLYPEVRRLLQRLGSDAGRDILGDNIWVDITFRNIPDGAKVVITDCRFPNEATMVKQLGGQMWRVRRPGYAPVNAHPSEVALDDWNFDCTFDNDTTIEALHGRVHGALGDDGF